MPRLGGYTLTLCTGPGTSCVGGLGRRHVHAGWPISEVRRIHRNSARHNDFLVYRSNSVGRLNNFSLAANVLQSCAAWAPLLFKIASVAKVPESNVHVAWLILGYHPMLRGVFKIVRETIHSWSSVLGGAWHKSFKVQVAYTNVCRPLHLVLRI